MRKWYAGEMKSQCDRPLEPDLRHLLGCISYVVEYSIAYVRLQREYAKFAKFARLLVAILLPRLDERRDTRSI